MELNNFKTYSELELAQLTIQEWRAIHDDIVAMRGTLRVMRVLCLQGARPPVLSDDIKEAIRR